MEQQRVGLQIAAKAKREMAKARAMELEAKHPQLSLYDNEVEDNSPAVYGSGSGGEAGLARVVGKGKKKATPKVKGASNGKMLPKLEIEEMEEHSDKDMEGGGLSGGARQQGKMLADHLEKMHGGGWLRDFAKGLMSGVKAVGSVVGNLPGPVGMLGKLATGALEAGEKMGSEAADNFQYRNPKTGGRRRGRPCKMVGAGDAGRPSGIEVSHAPMEDIGLPGAARGGQDVPKGGLAPKAYGNPPQAPASFARNTVGMGKLTIHHGGAAPKAPKRTRAPSQRNMMISKLMKEKGMTLPEASRYLKEHGSA